MKFTKGLMLGTLITAGAMMMYSEGVDSSKKKMVLPDKKRLEVLHKLLVLCSKN